METRPISALSLLALSMVFAGCSTDGPDPIPQDYRLQDLDPAALGWDQPDDRYRIGLKLVVVKLSKELSGGKPCFIALSTTCPKDGLSLPVLWAEKMLHCPGCGSDFDFRGVRLRGSATEDLSRHRIVRGADGKLSVGLTVRFKREGGGWAQAGASVPAD